MYKLTQHAKTNLKFKFNSSTNISFYCFLYRDVATVTNVALNCVI